MLSSFILIYQYFDNQEVKLMDQINMIQARVLYRDGRHFTTEELQELLYLKIKLDFVRKIGSELLQMFQSL